MSETTEHQGSSVNEGAGAQKATQIDFYHLKDDKLALAVAMLADKAVASGHKMLVMTAQAQIPAISEALWTTKPDSFLAHGCDDDEGAENAPVWITTQTDQNSIQAHFACVTDGMVPADINGFDRIFNIFDGTDDGAVQHARAQWKGWTSEPGFSCRYFAQDEQGRWTLKR